MIQAFCSAGKRGTWPACCFLCLLLPLFFLQSLFLIFCCVSFAFAQETAALPGSEGTEKAVLQKRLFDTQSQREKTQKTLQALTESLSVSAERQEILAAEIASLTETQEQLNRTLLRTTAQIQSLEQGLTKTESHLLRLQEEEGVVRRRLQQHALLQGEVLAMLQRVGRHPPPALVSTPHDARRAVRAVLLLNAALPDIHERVKTFSKDLENLRQIVTEAHEAQQHLLRKGQHLAEERHKLELLLKKKNSQALRKKKSLVAEQQRTEKLASESRSLQEFLEKLEGEEGQLRAAFAAITAPHFSAPQDHLQDPFSQTQALRPHKAFSTLKGEILYPVAGTPLLNYGQIYGFNASAKGVALMTRPGSRVTAPADGWVMYAGPFRSYGQLLILNPGEEYAIVLAGLEEIDVHSGQFVLSGEPVGRMGRGASAGAMNVFLGTTQPVLYVEFRKGGRAIDPTPWWQGAPSTEVEAVSVREDAVRQ